MSADLPTQPQLRAEWLNMHVPPSLKQIITERIDGLTPAMQMLLKVCAVVCHGTFSIDMAQAVSPTTLMQEDALRLFTQLEALNLISSVDESSRAVWARENEAQQVTYAFCSTLVQEVVYRKLPERQRRDLHGKAAAYMAQCRAADAKQARSGSVCKTVWQLRARKEVLLRSKTEP